jgi:hypothetical protein
MTAEEIAPWIGIEARGLVDLDVGALGEQVYRQSMSRTLVS